jgi:ABC-type antimicrobial peptide transport system permease subunit
MSGVMVRLRAQLRWRRRGWIGLALLLGLAGSIVLTTAAGARRTASAYDRFLRSSHAAEFLVSPDRTGFPHLYADLARATGAHVTPVIGYGVSPVESPDIGFLVRASPDAGLGTVVERPKVTAGRLPRASDASEVLADTTAARLLHLRPGSRLRVQVSRSEEELPSPGDVQTTLHVVGIGVTRDNVVSVNALANAPTMLATPAFARQFGPDHYAFDGAEVTLAPGASKSEFAQAAQAIARRLPETGGNIQIADSRDQAEKVDHAIRPQAVALALFALVTALIALFAIGQLLVRQLSLESTENGVLRALGMSRRQLLVVELAQVVVATVTGALLAVLIAIGASPMMPIGPARVAEPSPGISVDWWVLALGFVGIVVVLVAGAAWPAWRYASRANGTGSNDGISRRTMVERHWVTRVGTTPTRVIGIRHAIETGRGRSAVPSRPAIAVIALSVAAITASATFGTNLSRLVHTPRLYGQAWDVTVDSQFSPLPTQRIEALLRTLPGVAAWTYGTHTDLTVDRSIIPAIALVASKPGPFVAPTVVDGQAAEEPAEVMLGAKSLQSLHRNVGDTISATLPQPGSSTPPPTQLRIVGRGVFPFFGEGSFTPTGLGVGAEVTEPLPGPNSGPPITVVLISVAPGRAHDAEAAGVARAFQRAHICGAYNQCATSTAIRPADILNYSRIQTTPLALSVALALLAIGIIANLLLTSIRRRRYDYAILKALGVTRRGISATVAWQATTVTAVALFVGIPIGIATGRWIWSAFADGLGIPSDSRTPTLAVFVAALLALLLANAIAAFPGYLAGGTKPARVLARE